MNFDTVLPNITETEFKKHVGALTSMDPGADRSAWMEICIDPRLEVVVLDDVDGSVLFKVPPILYTSNELTGKGVANVLKTVTELNAVSALHGKGVMDKLLTKDLIISKPPEKDIKTWEWIVNKYIKGLDMPDLENSPDELLSDGDGDW